MTKATALRCIEEIESKLAELRKAVEEWSEETGLKPVDPVADLFREETTEESKDMEAVFALLREVWNIPADYKPEMTLEEAQNVMAEGLPERWASKFSVRRVRDARLTFAGGALILPLTKGMLHASLEPQ